MEILFYPVDGAVVHIVYFLHRVPSQGDISVVGAVFGVHHVLVYAVHGVGSRHCHFHDNNYRNSDRHGLYLVVLFPEVEHEGVKSRHKDTEPHSRKNIHFFDILAVGGDYGVLLVKVQDVSRQKEEHPSYLLEAYSLDALKSLRRHDKHKETYRKRVSVGQPVGYLKAVPYQIDGGHIHRKYHRQGEESEAYLLAELYVAVKEIQRNKQYGYNSAVYHRRTLGTAGVVNVGENIHEKVREIELSLQFIAGVGKLEFAEAEAVIKGYQQPRSAEGGYYASAGEFNSR